jgi:hypothetical protein
MPDHISKLSDAELADRYARVDCQLRQLTEYSSLMEKLEELQCQIQEELEARLMKERAGNAQ